MKQINIKNNNTYNLALELSRVTGESLTQAITKAIEERLKKLKKNKLRQRKGMAEDLLTIADELSILPELDSRHPDEILYNKDGLPK